MVSSNKRFRYIEDADFLTFAVKRRRQLAPRPTIVKDDMIALHRYLGFVAALEQHQMQPFVIRLTNQSKAANGTTQMSMKEISSGDGSVKGKPARVPGFPSQIVSGGY